MHLTAKELFILKGKFMEQDINLERLCRILKILVSMCHLKWDGGLNFCNRRMKLHIHALDGCILVFICSLFYFSICLATTLG